MEVKGVKCTEKRSMCGEMLSNLRRLWGLGGEYIPNGGMDLKKDAAMKYNKR